MGKIQKRPRKPTRNEKELIKRKGLSWNNWLVSEIGTDYIEVIHKVSETRRVIRYDK